jgi:hypothetical protein
MTPSGAARRRQDERMLDHLSIRCAEVRDPDGNNVEAVSHSPE